MSLFSWFKKPLKPSVDDGLRGHLVQEVLVTQSVNSNAYHEIIPTGDGTGIVRVYATKTGELLLEKTETTLDAAKQTALAALNQHNGVAP
jgi:hypothetical protein